jgi:hypothetical protein
VDTITQTLEELHDAIDELGLNPVNFDVFDDDDMIVFALRYLKANLDHAFEEED